MTLSIWRFTHLAVAIIASLFLVVASATGIVLAYDAAQENFHPYKVENFNQLNLAETLPNIKKTYSEITEISVDDNGFVLLEGSDADGNAVKGYINPKTGKILGKPLVKSDFINWTISLHRSLFLKESGRFIVGIVSILLLIMGFSGLVLVLKRQKGIAHFFDKIKNDFTPQYLHVVFGRLLLLPTLFTTITATYLFLVRFDYIQKNKTEKVKTPTNSENKLKLAEFPVFKNTKLSEVQKIEFPFIEDDPEENFVIKLKDKSISVNQINGTVVESQKLPTAEIYENLNLMLHTGRGNWILAVILGLTSISLLAFIYTGFSITFKRTKNKIQNKFSAEDAEIILLVGSENGSTIGFAKHIHEQLLSLNKKSYLAKLNQFQTYPKAEHLVIFTSTYGLGDAPTSAEHFEKTLENTAQTQEIKVSVVGFGSTAYDDFCGYAEKIQEKIAEKSWAKIITPLYRVNDKSTHDFVEWAKAWSYETMIPLATAPTVYQQKIENLKTFMVVERSEIVEETTTFKIHLKPRSRLKFQSGDLLAIYPKNDHTERFYSVGKVDEKLQLVVKLHENGLGSGFLHQLKEGDKLKARLMPNEDFHFRKDMKTVAMIANGTGIAPFLGMVEENQQKAKIHLYCGFRKDSELTKSYQNFAKEQMEKGKISTFQIAYSREENAQYVMDLVKKDADFFVELIKNENYILICGALKMQHDIEKILADLCKYQNLNFQEYKKKGYLKTDCY
jgi:sulfite reductase (NADPH) flavoprotein alpha-component